LEKLKGVPGVPRTCLAKLPKPRWQNHFPGNSPGNCPQRHRHGSIAAIGKAIGFARKQVGDLPQHGDALCR
jgi:hypothetical protein